MGGGAKEGSTRFLWGSTESGSTVLPLVTLCDVICKELINASDSPPQGNLCNLHQDVNEMLKIDLQNLEDFRCFAFSRLKCIGRV